jgi:hypothetical protein
MSESRDKMIAALRKIVFPTLREMGFSGSFPHFRRILKNQIDLLTFQFNRHAGSFLVEIACCSSDGFTTHWGKQIPPKKVSAHDLHPDKRLRLKASTTQREDSWFYYEPECESVYENAAQALLPLLCSIAEPYWQMHKP